MELYLGILLGLLAFGLVVWAMVRPRKGEVPHCRRCGFSLAGLTEPGRCPECGSELSRKRAVVIGERRRKRRPMWWAAGLVVAASSMLLIDRASVTGYMPVPEYKPAWLLAAEAYSLGDRRASMATDEIVRRVQIGELTKEHNDRLVSISLARHAQTWRSFPDAQWQVITDAISARQLTTAEIMCVIDDVFEDGFVIGSRAGSYHKGESAPGYFEHGKPFEPGGYCYLDIGINYRAGQHSPTTTLAIAYLYRHTTLVLHERPEMVQNTINFNGSVGALRSSRKAGQSRVDTQSEILMFVPWIDGSYTGTAEFRFELDRILSLASDSNANEPGTPNKYAIREIPIEFEVVSSEKHRFPVMEFATLPGEASSYIEFKQGDRYAVRKSPTPNMYNYHIELKQDAGIDWKEVGLAGHLVLRQGDRVARCTFAQLFGTTDRVDIYVSPKVWSRFKPGEVQVSYEHNEALAAKRFRFDYYLYKQILSGPIELGTITIPEPSEPE
jgi:hypothetical protein